MSNPVPPGASCLIAHLDGDPVARASMTVTDDLQGAPGRSGMIGHYEVVSSPSNSSAGPRLLEHACRHLARSGVERVLGPMNGSTWARYRLVIDQVPTGAPEKAHHEPPFLMEPWNPPDYPDHFREAGFRIRSEYVSAAVHDLTRAHPRRQEAREAIARRGIVFEPLDVERFDEGLAEIHRLSLEAFSANPLYSPLPWDDFRAMYSGVRPLLDPSLVKLARDPEGRLVGFFFALPDPPERGERPTRLILKTAAVTDSYRGTGLGTLLIDEPRRIALELGYDRLIHALMHVENPSARISKHSGEIFRRYALFEWSP